MSVNKEKKMFPYMTEEGKIVHLNFRPCYSLTLEEIVFNTGSADTFMTLVESKTTCDRVLISIDSVPMANQDYRMGTHVVTLIK